MSQNWSMDSDSQNLVITGFSINIAWKDTDECAAHVFDSFTTRGMDDIKCLPFLEEDFLANHHVPWDVWAPATWEPKFLVTSTSVALPFCHMCLTKRVITLAARDHPMICAALGARHGQSWDPHGCFSKVGDSMIFSGHRKRKF